MKKMLLDTADLEEISFFMGTSAISGVTTNPSLAAKIAKRCHERAEKYAYLDYVQELVTLLRGLGGHLSVEVLANHVDPIGVEREAMQLHEIGKPLRGRINASVYVKIPTTLEMLPVITRLSKAGVNVNATACMTASQAKMASDAGANIVSFFYNRMLDHTKNTEMKPCYPEVEIPTYKKLFDNGARVICGSIRNTNDVIKCWDLGADYVTASPSIIREMMHHPKTDEALIQFDNDANVCRRGIVLT